MAPICPLPTGRASVHKTAGWLYQSVRGDCWAAAAAAARRMASATTVNFFIDIVGQLDKLPHNVYEEIVGQLVKLRAGCLPALWRRVTNPPQVDNLPHI